MSPETKRWTSHSDYEEKLGEGGPLDLTVIILSNFFLDIYASSTALGLG